MKSLFFSFLLFITLAPAAQPVEEYVAKNIKTIKFHMYGNPLAAPVWMLNSSDRLELHFDDMDGNVKNYSYSFELRNADWSPTMIGVFDYVQGFTQVRLTN